jgi:hypothetical protein
MALPLVFFAFAGVALAQTSVPQQLDYEGWLSDLSGTPSTGTHSIQFAIWPGQTGGTTALWSDTLSVTVVDGLYSATLGTTAGDSFPPGLFDGTVRYLEITVDGDLLSPREALGSVPYAILSAGVQGGAVNASSLAVNGIAVVNSVGRAILDAGPSVTTTAGIFCGSSTSMTTGRISEPDSGIVGYRATKLLCQGICGSPTAHMCSGTELVRTVELGVELPSAYLWYSTGVGSYDEGYIWNDCNGWNLNKALGAGSVFIGDGLDGGDRPTGDLDTTVCTNSYSIACCD